jgi:phosphonate metabolism-associated iron-containing alcohol dehydrogenase
MCINQFNYYNPVSIEFGSQALKTIQKYIGNKKAILITSPSFLKNEILNTIKTQIPTLLGVFGEVQPNPTFENINHLYNQAWKLEPEIIVALGGGSVIDSAKAVAVFNSEKNVAYVNGIIRGTIAKENVSTLPVVAIPSTSGTGSDVTPWATVWDMIEKKKYSLHLPNLWPVASINDPAITLTMPAHLTVQTALDALSHSLESIWNKNANPVSIMYAVKASKRILENLPKLIDDLENLELRTNCMQAALYAGMAFSNTQTAVAHAISYYITAKHGVPHGYACSFSLPNIIDTVKGSHGYIDDAFEKIFGEISSTKLRAVYKKLGMSTKIMDYIKDPTEIKLIKKSLMGNQRAGNSLVDPHKLFNSFHVK